MERTKKNNIEEGMPNTMPKYRNPPPIPPERKSPNLEDVAHNMMLLPDIEDYQKKPERKRTMIGVDNGTSGGVTILSESGEVLLHIKTPVKNHLSYTKKKAFINRINFQQLKLELQKAGSDTFCYIERPMVNPTRFMATVSAVRCLEATEILLEELQIPYQFLDSKEWQKVLLPSGLKGAELKMAADDVAKRLFPKLKVVNSDCLLIAEYCRRKNSK